MPGYAVIGQTASAVEGPLWRRLGAADRPASVRDLHLDTDAHPNAIQHRLDRWVRAGLVTRIDGRPKRYAMNENCPRTPQPPRVTRDGTVTARPATTMRDRLWRSIRVLRSFDLPTLMIAAGATRRSAEDYLNCLHRAGYLRLVKRGNSASGTWSTYRLVTNTGPRTPSVSHHIALDGVRRRELVDANCGARIDISPAAASLRAKRSAAHVDDADGGVS